VFTSWAFVWFFIVVLVGLQVLRGRTQRQAWLLCASVFFCAYWSVWFVLLLATPSVVDYACALRIEAAEDQRLKQRWLAFSVVSNLGLLAYFKYVNFFVSTFGALLSVRVPHLDIALPIGISFYTFKTLSYTIDVYRGDLPACRSLWRYAMFVTYFP